jgi:L-ascorbate metabolism protein UlaG (beta-lactamase superfamily)
MYNIYLSTMLLFTLSALSANADDRFQSDVIRTSSGDLKITFIGHASLIFSFNNKTVYVDPFSKLADYATLPKADVIVITHEHRDHLDPAAIEKIRTEKTSFVLTATGAKQLTGGIVIKNNDVQIVEGVTIEAVPAYNIDHKRDTGEPFHPRGAGNGYILTFGDKRVYVAGDTENIPEMAGLKNIDIAFLPMNLPYTMTPEMTAAAAKMVQPKILYPYHYGSTNTSLLTALLKDQKGIEVRIRKME